MTRCSHQQSPYQLLFGEPHIFEDLLDLKIRISPDAFFQINTAGAEMLYQTVRELSGVNSNTILLDTCCGTGVIGLSLAQHSSQVLGIELVEQAVEDARWTAAFNGTLLTVWAEIKSCSCFCATERVVWQRASPYLQPVGRKGRECSGVLRVGSCWLSECGPNS